MNLSPTIAVDGSIMLLFGVIWLCCVWFLRVKKKKSFVYLLFFTVFFIYLFKVLDYTLFQFQTLLILKHFMPNLMLNGITSGESVNLMPLVSLSFEDLRTSLLNVLLFVPFGLGLPFLTRLSLKRVVLFGAFFSIGIELVQFLTGVVSGMTFRIADVNDVFFNTLGAAFGCLLFITFVFVWRRMVPQGVLSSIAQLLERDT